jgi:hypothetical protein
MRAHGPYARHGSASRVFGATRCYLAV